MAPLQVICPGFSRTGTLSLQTALNKLGYNTMHFENFLVDESLDMEGFRNAIENREEADWDKLYENYNAVVDIPTWIWYKDLLKKYPDAKVILTVRDPESWYISITKIAKMIRDSAGKPDLERSVDAKKLLLDLSQSKDSPIYQKMQDKEAAMAAFEKHNQDVIDFVPKERLLVMQLGEGWERICEFLGKPIPDESYPNLNSPEKFQAAIEKRQEEMKRIQSLNVGQTN